MKIFTFDTTLRDGTQGESVSFSVDDKLLIAQKLDELGIDYIEGGWPGSNPKDKEFFTACRRAEAQARQADRLRLHALRQESGGGRPQRARAGRSRHAGRLDLRQELGPPRIRARSASPKKKTSSSSPRPCATSRTTARKWSTTPSISSTATSPTPTTRCARSKPPRRRAPMCSASATPTAARSPAGLVEIVAEVRKRFDGVIGIHTHNDSRCRRRQRPGRGRSRAPPTCRAA